MKLILMFLLLCAIFLNVNAQNHKIKDLSPDEFDQKLENEIYPFMLKGEIGSFTGVENAVIEYFKYIHPEEVGSVVILNGRAEYFLKYQELMYEFASQGYSVFTYDHRGQGGSTRLLDNPHKGHVGSFQHYIDDLNIFVNDVVRQHNPSKLLIFAHSLGGLVAAGYLEQYPNVFEKAVLSAPMFEMNTKPAPYAIAKLAAYTMVGLGRGWDYVPGGSDAPNPEDIEHDKILRDGTGSVVRFNRLNRDTARSNPELMLGGPTNWWLRESFKVTSKHGKKSIIKKAEKIKTPILLFQAGDDDWVKPGGQNMFCHNAKNCVIEYVEKSRHELWCEREEIRVPYMKKIFNFYGG